MSSTAAPALDSATRESNAGAAASRRAPRRLRGWLGWVAVAILAIGLWPANWGGLTGFTIVNGHSMDPTFASGDLIISMRLPAYHVGDIVSYEIPDDEFGAGQRVIHRIFAIDDSTGTSTYVTKGDNNPDIDEWRPASANVLGRVILRIPGAGILLDPGLLPYEAAGIAGILVTVLLWPGRGRKRSGDEA